MIPVILLAFANERHGERYLDKLPLEQARLREALEPAVVANLCELVVLPNATVEDILDTFQKARYKDRVAIFHYAGHADGYQLLLESRTGGNVTAHGSGVVSFLGKQASLKLIFLNGCSTQQQAEEMVEAGVPAVIGTSVSIADDIALNLAVRFYTGLGGGGSLERAWREAQDEVKMRTGGKSNSFRSLYWGGMNDVPDVFPWNLYIRPGSEVVNEWNLPDVVGNPLFGLPDVPRTYALPEEPYIFLRRFERKHAEVFFGRSYYIRDLYNRISDPKAEPVILLYGQSGVGKSSLFDAGLNPRLEGTHQVCYLRRDQMQGLLGTLAAGLDSYHPPMAEAVAVASPHAASLGEIEKIVGGIEDSEMAAALLRAAAHVEEKRKQAARAHTSGFAPVTDEDHPLAAQWKSIEQAAQKPLVVILDQLEELFTRPNPAQPKELHTFLAAIRQIFDPAGSPPRGRLILGYRKEYYAEIEEAFKLFEIPRSKIFLEHLAVKDIAEVVDGLASTQHLRDRYHLTVEEGLDVLIAEDLVEDKDSPVAPVLQILLTKLWQNAVAANPNAPRFDIADYQRLKREGILMDDFFRQQTAVLRQWNPELVESGMALDVLMKHTTRLGTAEMRTVEELRALYNHRADAIDPLLQKLNDLYLLQGAGSLTTGLAHDTLAPIVQHTFRTSDFPGQRATRLIENKAPDFDPNDINTALDEADLAIVEKGYQGMRVLTLPEQELLKISRKRRDRAAAFRRTLRIAAFAASVLIVSALGVALWQYGIAKDRKEVAERKTKETIIALDSAEVNRKKAAEKELFAQNKAKYAKMKEGEAILSAIKADSSAREALRLKLVAEDSATAAKAARGLADAKTLEAIESAIEANIAYDSARVAQRRAEEQRKVAVRARISADSSRYLALAERLGVQASGIVQTGQHDLARRLALTAWHFHEKNDGLPVSAILYDAMSAVTHGIPRSNHFVPRGNLAGDVVKDVAYLDGDHVLMVCENRSVYRKNIVETTPGIAHGDSLFSFPVEISRICYDSYNKKIIAIGKKTVFVADPVAGKPRIKELAHYPHGIASMTLLLNGAGRVAVACNDSSLHLLDYKNEGLTVSRKLGYQPNSLTIAPDGKTLFIGGMKKNTVKGGGPVGVVEAVSFAQAGDILTLRELSIANLKPVYSLAVAPDGGRIAIGTAGGNIILWDRRQEDLIGDFQQHTRQSIVYQVLFDKTGRFLISAGADKKVLMRDTEVEGAIPARLATAAGWCRWAYLAGDYVISGGNEKGFWVSALFARSLSSLLMEEKTPPLSRNEWRIYMPEDVDYNHLTPDRESLK